MRNLTSPGFVDALLAAAAAARTFAQTYADDDEEMRAWHCAFEREIWVSGWLFERTRLQGGHPIFIFRTMGSRHALRFVYSVGPPNLKDPYTEMRALADRLDAEWELMRRLEPA